MSDSSLSIGAGPAIVGAGKPGSGGTTGTTGIGGTVGTSGGGKVYDGCTGPFGAGGGGGGVACFGGGGGGGTREASSRWRARSISSATIEV